MINRSLNRRIPSPGPRPYDDRWASLFFGRVKEIRIILNYINGQRLSVLAAESASGKTSLLQAGLVPILRTSRLHAHKSGKSPLPPFPLLLNQWLGRAGDSCNIDFLRLLLIETDRYLADSIIWYKEKLEGDAGFHPAIQSEINAIDQGRKEIREIASATKLATIQNGKLVIAPILEAERGDYRKMLENLHNIFDGLIGALGPILLIFDQFEEILGDPTLGRQALEVVESIHQVRKKNVKQFLSLRSDASNLLRPLERKGLIEGKRTVDITRLGPEAVEGIVKCMSKVAEIEWEDEKDLKRLIKTFTIYPRDGGPGSDVNLLGLQVVLLGLFTRLIKIETSQVITLKTLREYCESLKGSPIVSEQEFATWLERHPDPDQHGVQRNGLLAEVAPRSWIEQCLEGKLEEVTFSSRNEPDDFLPEIIKPMVVKIADWLVNPEGFKRPLTRLEVENIAFMDDLETNPPLAGPAKMGNWPREELKKKMKRTCDVALDYRLVEDGHVLKKRGGEANAHYYELVHDQFGPPLKNWAKLFRSSPLADLGWPYAISDKKFPWRGRLFDFVPDKILRGVVWKGCTVEEVNFSDLHLVGCDFERTLFSNCIFLNTKMENCNFELAAFKGCTVSSKSTFSSCNLKSVLLDGGSFNDVEFLGGSLKYASILNTSLTDCTFGGKEELLPMRNLILVNSTFVGQVSFERCNLDGATIGGEGEDENLIPIEADNLIFKECDLKGMEMKNIHFLKGSLLLEKVNAKGAVFEQINLPKKEEGHRGTFRYVILTGAVFLGCELHDTDFVGSSPFEGINNSKSTEALMLVFRDLSTGDGSIPTSLDNVYFSDLDMENFSFQKCHILGPVEFRRCQLAGGTIAGSGTRDEHDPSWKIGGSFRFLENCDLPAIEFNKLSFVGRKLEISSCTANAAYFFEVDFSSDGRTGVLFDQSPMAGAMFDNCSINGVTFKGDRKNRIFLETMTIKGTNDQSTLKDCAFSHAVLDGFILDGMSIKGALDFTDCKLCAARIGNHKEKITNSPPSRNPMPIAGTITFKENCDLRDIHLNNILLEEGSLFFVEGGVCDGAIFKNIHLAGQIVVRDSSLLRTKFSQITAEGEKGRIKFLNSNFFNAEMDDNLSNIISDDSGTRKSPFIE